MIFRTTTTILNLLRKDEFGNRGYVYVKEHISNNAPTFVLFLVSTFLLVLLIQSNVVSHAKSNTIEILNNQIQQLSSELDRAEDRIHLSTNQHDMILDRLETFETDTSPPPKEREFRREKMITREIVLDKLKDIEH